jgi:hypothetical protein
MHGTMGLKKENYSLYKLGFVITKYGWKLELVNIF